MGVLGKLASAVVRSGAKLLRRGASDVRRVPVKGTAGIRKSVPRDLSRGAEGPVRGGYRTMEPGGRIGPPAPPMQGPRTPREIISARATAQVNENLAGRAPAGARFGSGGTARTGAFKRGTAPPIGPPAPKKAVSKELSPASAAVRRASVVGRRYFTQGTAGSGLNMKRAIPAAAAASVPISLVLGKGAVAIKRKFEANAQETPRSQQPAQTYQEGADKLASQSSATATGAIPGSSASSTSTDTSSGTTASTSSVGGLLGPEMKASAAAVRPDRAGGADRDYMGEAFDATLRKGVTSGRAYLKQQLASTKADSKKTQTLLDKYDRSVGKDTLLGRDRGVGYLKNSDSDQTQKDLLATYRGRFGQYRKNASATEIEAMAQTAATKRDTAAKRGK